MSMNCGPGACLATLALAAAMAAVPARAQAPAEPLAGPADPAGPYAVVAIGRSQHNYDCYFFSYCDRARVTAGRLGLGYRFGVVAVEGWAADAGRATIQNGNAHMRVQTVGLNAAFYLRFTPTVHGVLRVGGGQVVQTRSDDARTSNFEGSFGLGLVLFMNPQMGVELALDSTTATGQDTGSGVISSATVGLRLRF